MIISRWTALCGVAMAAWAIQASAVPVSCTADVAGDLIGLPSGTNAGCQLGSTTNDKLGAPIQVNVDQMFSFNDWVFAEKWGFDSLTSSWLRGEESTDIGLKIKGSGAGAAWGIANIWDGVMDVMLVVKGPNSGGTVPQTYVAYLLVDGDTAGKFVSPFSKYGRVQNISGITAYVRGVPEPTAVALLGLVLVALGITGHRGLRRRSQPG